MSLNATSTVTSTSTTTSAGGFPNFGPVIASYAQQFAEQIHTAIVGIDAAATLIAFYAGLVLIPIGAILFWSHISRFMGKGLLIGGIILIILSYTLFPALPLLAPPP